MLVKELLKEGMIEVKLFNKILLDGKFILLVKPIGKVTQIRRVKVTDIKIDTKLVYYDTKSPFVTVCRTNGLRFLS